MVKCIVDFWCVNVYKLFTKCGKSMKRKTKQKELQFKMRKPIFEIYIFVVAMKNEINDT